MRRPDRPIRLHPLCPPRTGLICPNCNARVAIVENQMSTVVVLWCRNCDHWWGAYEADAKPH